MTTLAFPDTTGQPTDGSFTYEANGVLYSWTGDYWAANNAQGFDQRYVNADGDTMTGDLTVPSLNGGPLAGCRNALVNGNLQINQRGYFTKAGAMNEYTVDRWVGVSASTGMTIRPETTLGGNYAEAGGAAPGDQILAQGIELPAEGVKGSFQPGTTWTVSVLAATGAPTVALNWQETVGQGANNIVELSATSMQSTGKTIGGYTQYSYTHTFSNTAITANQVALTVELGIGNNRCTQVQLEPGPVATPFEHRPVGLELSLCQRYYQTFDIRMTIPASLATATNGQKYFWQQYVRPVHMRDTPTTTLPNGDNVGGVNNYQSFNAQNGIQMGYSHSYYSTVKLDNPPGGTYSVSVRDDAEL